MKKHIIPLMEAAAKSRSYDYIVFAYLPWVYTDKENELFLRKIKEINERTKKPIIFNVKCKSDYCPVRFSQCFL